LIDRISITSESSFAMPSAKQIKDCALFLGQLVGLGVKPEALGTLEEAYWGLLGDPAPSKWDNESPFRGGSRAIDLEKCGAALNEDLGGVYSSPQVSETFFRLCQMQAGVVWRNGIDAALRVDPRSVSLGALLRSAAFIVLARGAGCWESRQGELDKMVLDAVGQ
jgi:hypothetical protein